MVHYPAASALLMQLLKLSVRAAGVVKGAAAESTARVRDKMFILWDWCRQSNA